MTTCIQCGGAFEGSGLACPACRGEVPRIFRTVEVHGRDRRFDLPAREVAA